MTNISPMEPVLIYLTAQDKQEAEKLARALLESRLVACVNILGATSSLYWWDGAIRENAECALIAKTAQRHVEGVIDKVRALHSASCPCVIALPITEGYHEFLDWIVQETKA